MTVMKPFVFRPSSDTAMVHLSPSWSLSRKLLTCCIACSVEEEATPRMVGESSSMPAKVSERKRTWHDLQMAAKANRAILSREVYAWNSSTCACQYAVAQ